MDTREHFASLWAMRVPAVLLALIPAVAVAALAYLSPVRYASSAVLVIHGQDGTAEGANFVASSFVALTSTRALQADVGRLSGHAVDGATLSATPAASSTLITVSAVSTMQASRRLALALGDALIAKVQQDRRIEQEADLAFMTGELDRVSSQLSEVSSLPPSERKIRASALQAVYNSLSAGIITRNSQPAPSLVWLSTPPTVTTVNASSAPWKPALVAFLISLIVASEGLLALRRLRGHLSPGDPARHASSLTDTQLLVAVTQRFGKPISPSDLVEVAVALRLKDPRQRRPVVILGTGNAATAAATAVALAELLGSLGMRAASVGSKSGEPPHNGAISDARAEAHYDGRAIAGGGDAGEVPVTESAPRQTVVCGPLLDDLFAVAALHTPAGAVVVVVVDGPTTNVHTLVRGIKTIRLQKLELLGIVSVNSTGIGSRREEPAEGPAPIHGDMVTYLSGHGAR